MVFVDPKDLRYQPFWERWIKSRTNKDEVAMLNNLYKKIVEPCVEFVSEGVNEQGDQVKPMKGIIGRTSMNLPKFVFEDVPLFLGLITDLFPGLDCPRVRYPNFNDAVEQSLVENNYTLLDNQVDKVIQSYETMMTRHSIMIVG